MAGSMDRLLITIPAAAALAWVTTLAFGAELGQLAYVIAPLFAAAGIAIAVTMNAVRHHARTSGVLYVIALFALNITFRQRDLGVTGLDWQNGAKLVIWAVILVAAYVRRHLMLQYLRDPAIAFAAAFAGMALISASWSETPAYTGASAAGVIAYLVLACMVVADLGSHVALRLALLTLASYVALGVAGALLVPEATWLAPSVDETAYRLQGFSGHPNVFAQQIGILIALAAAARRAEVIGLSLFLVLLAFAIASILATGSRTTLMAVALAWAIVALRSRRLLPTVLLAGAIVAAAIVLTAALGAFSGMDERVAELSRTGTASEIFTLTGRTEVWSVVWSLIQERPLLGWGYNGTEDLISGSMHSSFTGTAVNAHNLALQSLVSLGLLGTLPLLCLTALLIQRFFTTPDASRDQFMIFTFLVGLGEVAISASAGLLSLMLFLFLARDAESSWTRRRTAPSELRPQIRSALPHT